MVGAVLKEEEYNNNNNKSTKITIQCRIVMPLFVGMLKLHGFFVWQMSEREKKIFV